MAETTKYIAYISLDYLQCVFADMGWMGEPEKQQKFIDKIKEDVDRFIQNGDKNVYQSWKWTDNNGVDHNAVELMPVRVSDEDALFVTQEQWEALKKMLTSATNGSSPTPLSSSSKTTNESNK